MMQDTKTAMTEVEKQLALMLHYSGAVKTEGLFRLAKHEDNPDALESPYFLNFRTKDNPKSGPLTHDILSLIGMVMKQYVDRLGLKYDLVAGIPNAGDPFAEAFYHSLRVTGNELENKVGRIYFKKTEVEGRRKIDQLSGNYQPGQRVLLLDDVVTAADIKLKAINEVIAARLHPVGVVVLADRQQGGLIKLTAAGYPTYAVYKVSRLMRFYYDTQLITPDKYDQIIEYMLDDPYV